MLRQDDRQKNDLRRRALARRAARREEARRARLLAEAADAGPAMIWAADAEGAIEQVNRRWVEFLGYAPDPETGEGAAGSIHPDDYPGFRDGWQRAMRERAPLMREYRVRRRDGVWRWVLDSAEARFDARGRYLGHAGAAVDVTAQHEALDSLQVSDARFRGFAEASDDVYWMADAEVGRITFANAALERVWGASRERLFAEFDGYWRTLIHPDDLPRVDAAAARLRQGHARVLSYRVIRPRDGEERVVDDRAFLVRDASGVRLVGGIVRDITDIVRARERLERALTERTAELEAGAEQRRRAEAALAQAQRLETVGRLTGGMAHDFNNLLTVMIGALDMILRRPDQADRVRRLGQAAMDAGRKGERLVRQLLTFSRRRPLQVEAVDVGALVHEYEPMLRGAVGEATPLAMRIEPGLGARLDRAQLEAALLNLVVNAREALDPGGAVRVSVDRVRLGEGELPEVAAGDYVRLSVVDTGRGMDSEVAAHAFEPFFTTRPDAAAGSGLGLAQVYGFARQSGGAARIDSAPGEGTTVDLFLPSAPAPAAVPEAAAPPAVEPAAAPQGLRVLLVDDDDAVRATAEGLLLDLGFEVLTAADGPAALSVLERDPQVRLLLTDVVMPGMSGVELARAATARRPDLRVLLSTGYAAEGVVEDAGDWPVLRKPYRLDALDRAARRAMA